MEEARAAVLDLNVLLASTLKPEGYTAAVLLALYLGGEKLYVPDYVREEFDRVAGEVAAGKNIDPRVLRAAFQAILGITVEAGKESYERHLGKAESLVGDPKDAPYVALALHLRGQYKQVVILTYNKRDYLQEELSGKGIRVMAPPEFAAEYL